ncbi:hypothetical protein HDV63DRAFT_176916 [Trichoderma sp. SZMC 28014]
MNIIADDPLFTSHIRGKAKQRALRLNADFHLQLFTTQIPYSSSNKHSYKSHPHIFNAMCVHFQSWNRCSSCLLTFNRRLNRVPCWNGSLSRWRFHHHGLSCRNGRYERAPDEIYTHRCCGRCSSEAAKRAAADEKMKSGSTETATSEMMLSLRLSGKRVGRFVAATTRKATDVKKMLMRVFCGRRSVYRRKRGDKGHARGRIHVCMLGF